MRIYVTAEDIRLGGDSTSNAVTECAVARALNRTTGLQWEVGYMTAQCGDMLLMLSEQVSAKIKKIVCGKKVAPFYFNANMDIKKANEF